MSVLYWRVRIQIDSNAREFNGNLTMDVYPSTTVRELRAAVSKPSLVVHYFPCLSLFKVGYVQNRIPSTGQYWFVNGHLAYENSTMADLNVQADTLFILFVVSAWNNWESTDL